MATPIGGAHPPTGGLPVTGVPSDTITLRLSNRRAADLPLTGMGSGRTTAPNTGGRRPNLPAIDTSNAASEHTSNRAPNTRQTGSEQTGNIRPASRPGRGTRLLGVG